MKLLFAARLSVLHDGQTGLDTQEQEVVRWAEANGHEIIGIAADHHTGKSHLWDRPNLKPWVLEPAKLAQYEGIVALKVDRLTRADDEGVDAMKAWARENAKQLLISGAEVHFPSEGMEGGMWDLYIRMAHAEWIAIQERYVRMQNAKHDAGSIVGRAPWGYEIIKSGNIKIIEPTPEGRIWVPKIFAWIAEGKSSREVGTLLASNNVRSGAPKGLWHEATIVDMIKRRTYSGTRERMGRSGLQVEALVSRALQDEAIATLAKRARLGATGTKQPKALLAKLLCGHPDCPGEGTWPMYRIKTGIGGPAYRCTGRGAQRKGCGAPTLTLDVLDDLVLNMSEYWDTRSYKSQRFIGGNDAGVRLEQLRTEMGEAMRSTPAVRIAEVAADYAKRISALEAEGSILPHWEEIDTGETEGQHLRSLDLDGRREYLGRKIIKAWKDADGHICVTVDGALTRTGGSTAVASMIGDAE